MITVEHLVRHTEGNYRIPAGLAVEPAPDAPGHFILREFPEHIFGPAGVSGTDKSCLRRMAENGEFYIDGQNVAQKSPKGGIVGAKQRQAGVAAPQERRPTVQAVPGYMKPYLNVQGVEVTGPGQVGKFTTPQT